MTEPLRCEGTAPLTGRTEAWMDRLVRNPHECAELISKYGSPVNVHDFGPMARNINELNQAAQSHNVDFRVFFARKANKTFAAVLAAHAAGAGIDVASQRELQQCLEMGVPGSDIIFSAATKTHQAIDTALRATATISVDNTDELAMISLRARELGTEAQIAFRISSSHPDIAPTRFGLPAHEWLKLAQSITEADALKVRGIHFHLNGYSPTDRITVLRESLDLADGLAAHGHQIEFIDMGGGIPMSYLDSKAQWQEFWRALAVVGGSGVADVAGAAGSVEVAGAAPLSGTDQNTLATSCWGGPPVSPLVAPSDTGTTGPADIAGETETNGIAGETGTITTNSTAKRTGTPAQPTELTWRGDLLGLVDPVLDRPSPATYPYFQQVTRGDWLDQILGAQASTIPNIQTGSEGAQTIARALSARGIQLRCEPGRSLMDGCGMTIAQVAFTKRSSDGIALVGLHMNRTQVRSTSADFLVDPILIRTQAPRSAHISQAGGGTGEDTALIGAYLVGSYCIEEELILRRSLSFPDGVQAGDFIAFPNTGGYLMHILESASHQIPLAANVVHEPHPESAQPGDAPESEIPCAQWTRDMVDHWNG